MARLCEIVKVELENIATWRVAQIAKVVKAGGVIIYPTDTIYGLGCSPYIPYAVGRVHHIKFRSEQKPMLILIADPSWADRVAQDIPDVFFRLAKRFWPGPLTMVLKAKDDTPAILTAHTGTIGLRVPQQPFTRELVRLCEGPLVSTSANLSGEGPVLEIRKLIESFKSQVDIIVDAGDLTSGVESTVVSVIDDRLTLLREGRVPFAEIEEFLR